MRNIDESDDKRSKILIDYLKIQNIDICIPCLLAYNRKKVYEDIEYLEKKMKSEIEWAKKHFEKSFDFEGIDPTLIFIIFPIEDIDALRGDEGFYAGLR